MIATHRRPHLRRRDLLLGAASTGLLALCGCAGPSWRNTPTAGLQDTPLRLLGEARLPFRMQFRGTAVGGLSGLDYDSERGLWYALSDDGSSFGPARFYTLRIGVAAGGIATPEVVDVVVLLRPDRTEFPRSGGPDPESLRLLTRSRTLLWTSEGDIRRGEAPFLREMDLSGRHIREFELPPLFAVSRDDALGPRHNLTFEGLAILPDGSGAWVAMENALRQDGPVPGVGTPGGPCRFTLFDIASGRATQQFAYLPDAIGKPPSPPGGFADNGVSEILMVDSHRMLVLERAYIAGAGNSLRLYLVDTREASNTLGVPALKDAAFTPVGKRLLLDFSDTGLARLDNTEAMAWGPRLPGAGGRPGARTLVFASDDNFNPGQVTQFLAFEFLETE